MNAAAPMTITQTTIMIIVEMLMRLHPLAMHNRMIAVGLWPDFCPYALPKKQIRICPCVLPNPLYSIRLLRCRKAFTMRAIHVRCVTQ